MILIRHKAGIIILILLISKSNITDCQPLSNNFSVGNYIEIFNNDSIKIFYNCTGSVVEKRCAAFYRVGEIDSLFCNITGRFIDYFITGEVLFNGIMKYGKLTGIGTYFYRNGKISETGKYLNNLRTGEWKYFYPDGRLMKTYNFTGGEPVIINYYAPDGIEKVRNGNGNYVGFFNGYNGCFPFKISGKIKEGKMDSIWSFSGTDSEAYDKGRFLTGSPDSKDYKQYPMIHLQGFVANENCSMVENLIGCPGDNVFSGLYKGGDLHNTFLPKLEQKLRKAIEYKTDNQWIITGIEIDKNGKLRQINVHSSKNDTVVENKIYSLINESESGWESALINRKKVETDFLFTVIIEDYKIRIGTY